MNTLLKEQDRLQAAAKKLLAESPLVSLLSVIGTPIMTGSYTTSLMTYPDIDFSVQNSHPNIQTAIDLVPVIFERLNAIEVKVANFQNNINEPASFYIGIALPFEDESWHIDATVTKPGSIISQPSQLDDWIKNMTSAERLTILYLKNELINARRYIGARSQPPYTFRSVHVYEGVLRGRASSIKELEEYFTKNTKNTT